MNYRHIYHAGSFTDVLKHCVLLSILDALKRKDTPFCVLDTHAAIGLYPLYSEESQKSKEFSLGIEKLLEHNHEKAPALITQYLDIVKSYNTPDNLDFYPGSPLFIADSLRNQDRLISAELHKDDVEMLRKNMRKYDNVAVHHMDGYNAMKAFLPPPENRGVVLIDPPFEKDSEFNDIIKQLKIALTHWRGGIYLIWYPIKSRHEIKKFHTKLTALGFPTNYIEFSRELVEDGDEKKLQSCGLAIINTPWQVPELLSKKILPYLANSLDCRWKMSSENHS